ncbi:MAG: hypothetical protein U0837_10625 [Dehalococcoidia bacterium]
MKVMRPSAAPAVSWLNPRWNWKVWAMVVALLVPTLGFALWVLSQASAQTKIDPAVYALAQKNGDTEITAITGTGHTVYHSNKPLPDAKAPRADGKLTLVWFTNAACTECEKELFVQQVMGDYRAAVVFVEKAADRDAAAERLGVKAVPAFVWLDAEGNEVGRFGAVASQAEFRGQVTTFLGLEPAD